MTRAAPPMIPDTALIPASPGESPQIYTWGDAMTWDDYDLLVERTLAPFEGCFHTADFVYRHPLALQAHWPAHQRKETPVRLTYTDWGDPEAPVLLCVGGIANTARRWDYLALGLSATHRVLCLDWPGRGQSDWMPTQGDYTLDTNVEVLRQFLEALDRGPAAVVGSSLGGSTALALCQRHPALVHRLILNDIGPYIPAERRTRRAQAVARHYVFRRPADLFRRLGASAKNDGPIHEDELLHNTYFQTKPSEGGRIYRHDPRALQAYAEEAQESLEQWQAWARLDIPVLVVHGMLSDALLPDTLAEMKQKPGVTVMHVPDTGHTPALSDPHQIGFLLDWLESRSPEGDFTCLNPPAAPRHLFAGKTTP
ncbi:alpha/beta fold hydrolase [Pararhodospirillum photometricum]|nr:alpha/beta hydrolase [Pararhodospirillum photometricum]